MSIHNIHDAGLGKIVMYNSRFMNPDMKLQYRTQIKHLKNSKSSNTFFNRYILHCLKIN